VRRVEGEESAGVTSEFSSSNGVDELLAQGSPGKKQKHDSSVRFFKNQPIFVRFTKISENAREFLKLFISSETRPYVF
jgi:hypothetical protein